MTTFAPNPATYTITIVRNRWVVRGNGLLIPCRNQQAAVRLLKTLDPLGPVLYHVPPPQSAAI